MRKLPENLENPIDNLLVDIADVFNPYFKELGITPNILTTFNLIFTIASIYTFVNQEYKLAAIFFFLAYFFDCADGNYARKYDMVTQFGDYYDHGVDIFKAIVIYSLLFYTLYINQQIAIIILLILLIALQFVQLGCQEKYVEQTNTNILSPSLSSLKSLCIVKPSNLNNTLHWLRYVGTGTLILVTSIIIFFLDKLKD